MIKTTVLFKHVLLIIILFTISIFTQAQEFNAGVYGGLVAAQLDGDTYNGYNKPGIIVGSYVNREFNKKLLWQMGLRYSQKGSKFTNSKLGLYYKSQLHYLELPLTIQYYYKKKISFEVGASLNYLIKAMEDKDGFGLYEADPPFNKFELASIAGIYYHFSDKLAVGMHFSYSLNAVRPYSSGYEAFMDKGQHNNIFYFALYYKLSSWR